MAIDLPTFFEVLSEEETDLLVPPSDPRAMGRGLLQLADDPALRERLARNNREAVKFYTWEARARRIRNALDSLVEKTEQETRVAAGT